jgi:hypothetical protein
LLETEVGSDTVALREGRVNEGDVEDDSEAAVRDDEVVVVGLDDMDGAVGLFEPDGTVGLNEPVATVTLVEDDSAEGLTLTLGESNDSDTDRDALGLVTDTERVDRVGV